MVADPFVAKGHWARAWHGQGQGLNDEVYMKFYSCIVRLIFSFSLLITFHLHGEIERITLKWTQALCTKSCAAQLDKEFKKIQGISEFTINQEAGQADIKWGQNTRFSFSEVNVPMRLVGLSIRNINLKVKGTLTHDAKTVTLTSIGDNSTFQLLNPVISEPGKQSPVFNLEARQLSPELYQKLVDAESRGWIATVEGQMFMPGRSAAMQLIVEHLTLTNPDIE